ncbi:MAG: 50S ribosomal protein L25 [Candidatus Kaiserbacteria bacterium]|nr:50S ribosomal protein L25 [Candidatus Kaiserbacteria bacterium]MCB9816258.1 50S ribosomal protein L25 [Candidatus Nomurabacteria bacterium]
MTMTLAVTLRDDSVTLDTLRANGSVPAVIYGPKQEPTSVVLDEKAFDKVLKEAGEATVIELSGLSKSVEVLIKDVEFNPVKQRVMHVDLYAVDKDMEITAHVPLHFIGEAPVEESKEGSVTKVHHEIEVVCKPGVLPSHIDVDLSVLQKVSDKIHVSDLSIPAGVKVELDPEEAVVVISASRASGSEEESSEPVDMSSIEVEKKGKEDVEEEKA